jgi:hypothetical protein
MNQLYYRDLRKRVEALEAEFFPEPEPQITVCWLDEDGLPAEIIAIGRGHWKRRENEPIPPAILKYATPEARAAYEARPQPSTSPPQSKPPRL